MRSWVLVASVLVATVVVVEPAQADDRAEVPGSSTNGEGDPPSPPGVTDREEEEAQPKAADPSRSRAGKSRERQRKRETLPSAIRDDEGEGDRPKSAERPADGEDDEKKVGIGVDAALIVPLGEFNEQTGPIVGGTIKLGYDVSSRFQAYVRGGYQYGLRTEREFVVPQGTSISSVTIQTGTSVVPILFGGRYFLMRPNAGLYGALELGVNLIREPTVAGGVDTSSRVGANLGAGYVISPKVPINVGAQIAYLNLLGTKENEEALLGVSALVGYELRL